MKDMAQERHELQRPKAVINKAARKSPQSPKLIKVIANGQGEQHTVKLPESKTRVMQTVINLDEFGGLLPEMAHLTGRVNALRHKGQTAYLVLTADKLDARGEDRYGNIADGEKYKYYVVSEEEINAKGLQRSRVQATANKARASERGTLQRSRAKTLNLA